MNRALAPGHYFVMLTITGHAADGTSGTSNRRGTYTVTGRATEKVLFERVLEDLLEQSHIVTNVIVMLWHASPCDAEGGS